MPTVKATNMNDGIYLKDDIKISVQESEDKKRHKIDLNFVIVNVLVVVITLGSIYYLIINGYVYPIRHIVKTTNFKIRVNIVIHDVW